ncbi:ATPase associated with various cellular activities AAA_3 [Desulfatibacillum aliphaticivorans]|uniref:ATPase associated with various cellular activities AAA_3 n=1 Tax=Desulfatibacillum aliphaticivorans TaxID=218208 RepID=B8FAF0_DESAL|nr:MoxR family ATPase [Desulfatibacillum aliphaticivorans]ACL03246.1 ATPase associated with various cellular activities AAA_3 [Desulfatibacillum aliphaticivorans]
MPHSQAREICSRVTANIETVMRGQAKSIRLLMAGFASGGHVLLEDVPGTGKTTLAKALALSVALDFSRIQFTPDLLPSDILGVSVFDQKENAFNFHKGPIFTNILLADEINRSSPRTQSALLEAMAESQVSIDGKLRRLENVFFVIATQNPVETSGTYPLPEAQMDRFSLQFSLGYVSPEVEVSIMSDQGARHPLEQLGPCVGMKEVLTLRSQVQQVAISEELKRYIVDLVGATRKEEGILMGASPRASLALMKVSQALALIDNQSFVSPDHIQEVAVSVIAHRMVMDPQARFSGQTTKAVVENILKRVPVPA